MDQVVKDAIIESVGVDINDFIDKIREISTYGGDVIDVAPPSFTRDERVLNAKAGMTLLLEKAEELGLTAGQFIAMLIYISVEAGKAEV